MECEGVKEGIARGVSQACVFFIESHKSMAQTGRMAGNALLKDPARLLKTMTESALSSGLVFGMYFATYNTIGMANPVAGPAASMVTSFVKIPIGNAMRCVHIGLSSGLVGGAKHIVRMQGLRGLYGGYTLSLIEDMIEFDLRTRLYTKMKNTTSATTVAQGVGLGAIAGMIASGVTTPFDTVRANMVVSGKDALTATRDIVRCGRGLGGLYNGACYRMASNGVKYALFFMIFEMLNNAYPTRA